MLSSIVARWAKSQATRLLGVSAWSVLLAAQAPRPDRCPTL